MVKFITKSVCMALVAMLCVGSLNAQELLPKKSALMSLNDVAAVKIPRLMNDPTRATLYLTYLNGDLAYVIGNTTFVVGTTYYFSACINFTAGQMANYVGGTLHTVSLAIPQESWIQGWTGCTVWVKSTLNGAVVYEQPFTPILGDFTDIPLDEPQVLAAGTYVVGYTITIVAASNELRPIWCSDEVEDPYQPGGFNYMISQSPNYGSGASWYTFTSAGNLSIVGIVDGNSLPAKDLGILDLKSTSLKWVGNPATYTVTVKNSGTATQNNYTVQLVDASDNVLASQAVTTTLVEGASTNVTFNYTPTTPELLVLSAKVILEGDENPANDVSEEPLIQRIYMEKPMAYCIFSIDNGIGPQTPPATGHAAISYTAANMVEYAGKTLTSIDIGIEPGGVVSNGTVWVRNSRTGTNLYSQAFTPVDGWNFIDLDAPYTLTEEDTYIGYTVTITEGYPLGVSENSQVANVNHVGLNTTWWDFAETGYPGNMTIIGGVENDCDAPTNLKVEYVKEGDECMGIAKLTWDAPISKDDVIYNVYRDGNLIAPAVEVPYFDDNDFNPHNGHAWCVATVCGGSTSMQLCVNKDEPCDPSIEYCNPVKNLVVDIPQVEEGEACAATLTWDAPDNMPNAKYNIYRGITKIASEWEGTEFVDDDFDVNTSYIWTVRTVCLDNKEADGVSKNGKCEEIIPPAINELANSVAIYPNPTTGTITITADNFTFAKVEIYNTVGQLIETKTVQQFDISSYNTGVYLFKVYDEYNNSVTKRVMVTK